MPVISFDGVPFTGYEELAAAYAVHTHALHVGAGGIGCEKALGFTNWPDRSPDSRFTGDVTRHQFYRRLAAAATNIWGPGAVAVTTGSIHGAVVRHSLLGSEEAEQHHIDPALKPEYAFLVQPDETTLEQARQRAARAWSWEAPLVARADEFIERLRDDHKLHVLPAELPRQELFRVIAAHIQV